MKKIYTKLFLWLCLFFSCSSLYAQDCSSLYLIVNNGSVYDITALNGTLPSALFTTTNSSGHNLAVGIDANATNNIVFIHSEASSGSTIRRSTLPSSLNVNAGTSLPAGTTGLTTNPLTGHVYGFTTGRNLLRVYPTAANLGLVTGDINWTGGGGSSASLANDSFFDQEGNIYIVSIRNETLRLYKVNVAASSLTAEYVATLTSSNATLPTSGAGLAGFAFFNNMVYAAHRRTSTALDIYAFNPTTGAGSRVATYTIPNTSTIYIDLASCVVFNTDCEAGTEQVPLTANTLTNGTGDCADPGNPTVDLTSLLDTGTLPTGVEVVWFTTANHLPESLVSDPTAVEATGTYYAFFYDTDNDCYNTDAATANIVVTIVPPCEEDICTEPVEGENFSWFYASSTEDIITNTFNQPATNAGFVLDIYRLDNSFNMNINGIQLATREMQFQGENSTLPRNIRFASDGAVWDGDDVPNIWDLQGTADNPIIRVNISATGAVSIYGSRSSGGPLEPLELYIENPDNSETFFNTITWNTTIPNTVIVSQFVIGETRMEGYGSGLNIVPCYCTQPGAAGAPDGFSKVGVSGLASQIAGWPETIPNGFIALESKEKGFVITRVAHVGGTDGAPDLVNDAVTDPKEGMLVYDIHDKCVKLFNGSIWKCIERSCNDAPFLVDCDLISDNYQYSQWSPPTNVIVPYSNGDGSSYPGQTVHSTGVTGLTAVLAPGNLNNGDGQLTFVVSGTPSSIGGYAYFTFTFKGYTCTFRVFMSTIT